MLDFNPSRHNFDEGKYTIARRSKNIKLDVLMLISRNANTFEIHRLAGPKGKPRSGNLSLAY